MESSHKLLADSKAPNQLKVVTKIAISRSTEAIRDRGETIALYAISVAEWNKWDYINSFQLFHYYKLNFL